MIDHIAAGDHVHTGRHHGCGMNQGTDGCGAFHRVGQPDVQRNLGRFRCCTDEQCDGDTDENHVADMVAPRLHARMHRLGHARKLQRPEREENQHDADRKAPVPDSVDNERLLGGITRATLCNKEADQQVGTQPHPFPSDKQHQVAVPQDERQHREHEQVQIGEEPVVAVLVGHVAGGIDVDEKSDARHNQDHDRRQRIQEKTPIDPEPGHLTRRGMGQTGVDPFEHRDRVRPRILLEPHQLNNRPESEDERQEGGPACHDVDRNLGEPFSEEAVYSEASRGE